MPRSMFRRKIFVMSRLAANPKKDSYHWLQLQSGVRPWITTIATLKIILNINNGLDTISERAVLKSQTYKMDRTAPQHRRWPALRSHNLESAL